MIILGFDPLQQKMRAVQSRLCVTLIQFDLIRGVFASIPMTDMYNVSVSFAYFMCATSHEVQIGESLIHSRLRYINVQMLALVLLYYK